MVVDQMCWDYLYRYNSRFVEGGFKRLLNEGFNCHNTRINYIPSVTAIGHASVYTGSVPSIHGIAGNNFYSACKSLYCTQDDSVQTVGAEHGKSGQMSPRNMLSTSITDELKLATNFRSRVIGVALKDRGAILPAGHSADGAYWFDDQSGNFITSTYYMDKLPRWVERFNNRKLAKKYLRDGWKPLHKKRTYTESIEDENDFEQPWKEIATATLPLDTRKLEKELGLGVIRTTPMGNTLTLDMAKAAIEGEELGMPRENGDTDFLTISLSSTDYIGHRYATYSMEIEDTYLRLDQELKEFFDYLDGRYGKDGYLFFLTADHAAAHNLTFLESKKLPGRAWRSDIARQKVREICDAQLGADSKVFIDISNYQVFLDEAKIDELGANRQKLYDAIRRELANMPGVAYAVQADRAGAASLPEDIRTRIVNGYNHSRSGSIFVVLHPGWYGHGSDKRAQGTSHAVWSPYDTHIPLIFMGHGVESGHLYREVHITDIAATLAFMLKTQLPSGCIGRPITEILDRD
ncbi:MAG: alkaline phosphatase family protein [Porphyromonadaceae bacterium]|nr:alkaline phosphatase family protein [Porphyromonadaceae bacterium]